MMLSYKKFFEHFKKIKNKNLLIWEKKMKKITVEEAKNIELEILSYIDAFCKKK